MFDSSESADNRQVESWENEVRRIEAEISALRARQVRLIRRLDRHQVDAGAGMRTMGNWVSAHLDLSSQTGERLCQVARAANPVIDDMMAAGQWGLDRAAALVKLRSADVSDEQFAEAAGRYSLGRLYGLLDRIRSITAQDEEFGFEHRYLVIQPSLDDAAYRLWGVLPGVDGRVVESALNRRETELPVVPGEGHGQRRADALTSICLDAVTGITEPGHEARAVTVAEVFIDGNLAADTAGEAGAALSSGVRVGPNTLAEILCGGKVRVIATDGLHPVAYTDQTDAIPQAIRSYVLWRDMGQCSIEGCTSRYRLQPHHILERHHRGGHHPENLITVCWYHHHVAIHQLGFHIDPESPIHRRRLLPSRQTTGPPLRDLVSKVSSATAGSLSLRRP